MMITKTTEQVKDFSGLNPIRLEAHQFSEGFTALVWDSEKYGRSKYHHSDPFVKGVFMYHHEIEELGWGMN